MEQLFVKQRVLKVLPQIDLRHFEYSIHLLSCTDVEPQLQFPDSVVEQGFAQPPPSLLVRDRADQMAGQFQNQDTWKLYGPDWVKSVGSNSTNSVLSLNKYSE